MPVLNFMRLHILDPYHLVFHHLKTPEFEIKILPFLFRLESRKWLRIDKRATSMLATEVEYHIY